MKRTLAALVALAAVAVLLGLAGPFALAQDDRPDDTPQADKDPDAKRNRVDVVGLGVFVPDPTNRFGQPYYGNQKGTILALRVVRPGKTILRLDKDSSTLKAFTDDRNTVLSKPGKGGRFEDRWLGPFPQISDDRHSLVFDIRAEKLPAPGASALTLQADVVLVCGSDLKTSSTDTKLAADAVFDFGPIPVTVDKVRKVEQSGKDVWAISLRSNRSVVEAVREWSLLEDGEAVKFTPMGRWRAGDRHYYNFSLDADPADRTFTFQATFYAKTETLTLPVNKTVGLGLAPKADD
jgi:hypothetical protein